MQYSQTLEVEKLELAVKTEFTDAHCHINLFKNPIATIRESRERGVGLIIAAGGSLKDSVEVAAISKEDPVFAVVGIGPDFAQSDSAFVPKLEELILSSRKIIGIGEIGIDVKVADKKGMALQKEVFSRQLALAQSLELPVVIHSRGALQEITEMLEERRIKRAMFHFFDGDEKQAEELAEKGYLISIPPADTSKRRRIVQKLSLDRLVAETDSPIVGKSPADVIGVCEKIARLKGVSLEEVAEQTTENIRNLFYI